MNKVKIGGVGVLKTHFEHLKINEPIYDEFISFFRKKVCTFLIKAIYIH
jgi:hypothetical protein